MALKNVFGLLAALVCVGGFLAPNHYYPWSAYYNEIPSALVLAPVVVWCLFDGRGRDCSLPWYLPILFALPLVPLLQWCFGLILFFGDAGVASLYLAGAMLACYAGYRLTNSPSIGMRLMVGWFSWMLLTGAIVSALLAMRQVFGLSGDVWEMQIPLGGRPGANLSQPNQLSTLLLLGFVSLVYLRSICQIGDVGFCVTAFTLGVALSAGQSRSALLVEIALAIWLIWKLPQSVFERKKLLVVVLSALAGFVFLWLTWPHFYGIWLGNDHAVTRNAQDVMRFLIWRQMFEAMMASPILGYGWGQIGLAQMAVASEWTTGGLLQSAHNVFIDLLIWNGVFIGGLLILSIIVWSVRRIIREQTIGSWYALAVIGTVSVHALLEYPLHYAYFLLPVAAMVGVVDAELPGRTARISKLAVGVLALFSLTLLASVLAEYPVVEEGVRRMRFQALGADRPDNVRDEAQKLKLLSQYRGFLEFSVDFAREGMSNEELNRMQLAAHRFPYSGSLFRYALALGLNGYPEVAMRELQFLRNLHGEQEYLKAKNDFLGLRQRYPKLKNLNFN